jgi:hypothetical protein
MENLFVVVAVYYQFHRLNFMHYMAMLLPLYDSYVSQTLCARMRYDDVKG